MLGRKGITIILAVALMSNICSPVFASTNIINNEEVALETQEIKADEEIKSEGLDEETSEEINKEISEEISEEINEEIINDDEIKEENIIKGDEDNSNYQDLPADYNNYDSLEYTSRRIDSVELREIKDVNIISRTPITVEQAKQWARKKGATETFINLADLFWKYAPLNGGVNPAVAYVQSAKETGYGKFGGVLDETYFNTCGLKTSQGGGDYDAEAHQRFENWDQGVQAHLDHLALYAGAEGYPRSNTYDPRHFPTIKGKAKTAYELGGKWAPSPEYGTAVAGLYTEMMKFAGHIIEEDNSSSHEGGWKKENGNWYYINSQGEKVTDWVKVEGKWYYLDSSGVMKHSGWHYIKGSYYYLYSDGSMATGFINDGYDDYYLDKNVGNVKYGWQIINDVYYYFDANSGAMKKGWYHDGYDWYYLDAKTGIMKTGLVDINGETYYLKNNGVMATGWQVVDGSDRYFYSSGVMARSTTIDGYKINSNGIYKAKTLIVIDAGHSATGDRGSNKSYNGKVYYEGDLNMDVAMKLKNELLSKGYEVKMTREFDNLRNIGLEERSNMANMASADLFVSIHHDSGVESASGVTSFYSSYKPKLDEQDIVEKKGWGGMIKVDETPSYEAQESKKLSDTLINSLANGNGFNNRKSHDRNLYVTRETTMPAILVECGFITNTNELQRLSDSAVQAKTAKLIADSIDNFYK